MKLPAHLLHPRIYVESRNFVVLDFETSGSEYGTALVPENEVVLACWYVVKNGSVTRKYKLGNEFELHDLVEDVEAADFVVAHNAKYEAQWLKRCGVNLRRILLACTYLGDWVINGNLQVELNLDAVAKRHGVAQKEPVVKTLIASGVPITAIPEQWLLDYCFDDVESCYQVFLKQRKVLADSDRIHIWHTRNLTALVLADIEFNGMTLDRERVLAEYERVTSRIAELEGKLSELHGGVNLNSPKQLAEFLYKTLGFEEVKDHKGKPIRTSSGAPSCAAPVLKQLKATNPHQKEFLDLYAEYNRLDSLLTKNLEFFYGSVRERAGRMFASLNQGRTKTHRLSSTGRAVKFELFERSKSVQFQNLPREYKRLFCASKPGYLVGECDGAQLEFRVAADLGRDEVAKKEIENDTDVHQVTADTLTAAGEPTSRQSAKSRTFRPLYGGSRGTPAEEAYCEFFKHKYAGIAGTQRGWAISVLDSKYLRTPYGIHFFWPECRLKRGYIEFTTEIYNFPVQGFATAEIIPIALVYFWYRTEGLDITILNTIHDSIKSEFPPELASTFEAISVQCLTLDVYTFLSHNYKYEFKVPLGVGIKTAENWGDTDVEKTYNVWPDQRARFKTKQGKTITEEGEIPEWHFNDRLPVPAPRLRA